jgi:1-aminocyclopropane-1-carboxylate deaminase/D-cysteine desulfhydrase-like pyridoxal-dependent ACC family enzyme
MTELSAARQKLESSGRVAIGHLPSPIDELPRLRDAIGLKARLLAKRDDQIPFGFGGNKVRKLTLVAADAIASGADTLITCGGVQSNHCRATAAVAAQLGLACHLVVNGTKPERPSGNAALVAMYGANMTYVATREERAPTMNRVATAHAATGRKPVIIPLGASTPLGAMAIALGVGEMVAQGVTPDVIVHASSSGGTQAGLIAGCALYSPKTRVIGISADDPARSIRDVVLRLVAGVESALGLPVGSSGGAERCDIDDTFVGGGYGVPTDESIVAQQMAARFEAIVTDHWYTAKAMAGLMNRARRGEFDSVSEVLFWHTGGQPSAITAV